MFLQFADTVSTFIISNLIFSVIIFLIIWPVQKYLFKNNFRWQYAVLTLFLMRIILPVDLGFSFNLIQFVTDIIVKETNFEFYTNNHEITLTGIYQHENFNLNALPDINYKKVLLFCFWLIGSSYFMITFISRREKYKNLLKQFPENDNFEIDDLKDKWKNIFKIHREIQVKIGSEKLIPFTIGIIKPVIVLPNVEVNTKTIKNLEAIIAHEMAHIKRLDDFRLVLFAVLQPLYFFNPLIWFIVKKLCAIQEMCCDQDVLLAKEISRRDYGMALLNSAVRQNYWNLIYLSAMADFKKNLTRRLFYIKGDYKLFKRKNPMVYIVVLVLVTILLSVSLPFSQPVSKVSKASQSLMRSDPEFQKPLDNIKVTSEFGNQINPIDKKMRHHDGIDLSAKKGANVYAAESGQVTEAAFRDTYGNVISIQHQNGYITLYSHLSEIKVEKGQRVKKGDVIGLAGNTGVSTGPHLHFEIRKDDDPINPKDLIQF